MTTWAGALTCLAVALVLVACFPARTAALFRSTEQQSPPRITPAVSTGPAAPHLRVPTPIQPPAVPEPAAPPTPDNLLLPAPADPVSPAGRATPPRMIAPSELPAVPPQGVLLPPVDPPDATPADQDPAGASCFLLCGITI